MLIFRKVHVLGLCEKTIFDTEYLYTIDKNGKPLFLGIMSSVIFYEMVNILIKTSSDPKYTSCFFYVRILKNGFGIQEKITKAWRQSQLSKPHYF